MSTLRVYRGRIANVRRNNVIIFIIVANGNKTRANRSPKTVNNNTLYDRRTARHDFPTPSGRLRSNRIDRKPTYQWFRKRRGRFRFRWNKVHHVFVTIHVWDRVNGQYDVSDVLGTGTHFLFRTDRASGAGYRSTRWKNSSFAFETASPRRPSKRIKPFVF